MKKIKLVPAVFVLFFVLQVMVLGQEASSDQAAKGNGAAADTPAVSADKPAAASDTQEKSLLEGVAGSEQAGKEGEQKKKQSPLMQWLPLVLIFIILWFFMLRGPKKRQQEQQKMLNEMKKNDRVRTIGGIFGTIVDVRDEDVIIKVDESTNTKIRVARTAISRVMNGDEETKS